jgi:hypothetical protein
MGTKFAFVVPVLSGALVWIVVGLISGRPDAWDSSAYWLLGYPMLIGLSWLFGSLIPQATWRWGIYIMLGQLLAGIATARGSLNLLPLSLALLAILAIPCMLAAYFGKRESRKAP